MLKSNYYHYLDADYTNDADFLFLSSTYKCNFLGADNKQ